MNFILNRKSFFKRRLTWNNSWKLYGHILTPLFKLLCSLQKKNKKNHLR